ncbi:MAG TPA: acyltransferase [Azospirillaceae bacterium]|nr:acyltransferase [Azospirillaceae bacterium]
MFLGYIHLLRGVAILLIVATHCLPILDWTGAWQTFRVLDILTTNGTVMFVFISGFLFQHLSSRFEFRHYLSTKFRYVILPYLVVSIPAIAFRMAAKSDIKGLTDAFYEQVNPVLQVLWFLVTGAHLGPMWFIPVIGLIYLLAPLLVRLDRDARVYWALPALLVAASFVHRPADNANPLHALVHLLPVYMAGMFASRYKERLMPLLDRSLWPLAGLWAALCVGHFLWVDYTGIIYVQQFLGAGSEAVEWTYFQKLVLMAVLIAAFRRWERHIPAKAFDDLATFSFSIYFLHGYLTLTASRLVLWEGYHVPGNVPVFLLLTLVVTVACIAFVKAVKAVTGARSRLLVGS